MGAPGIEVTEERAKELEALQIVKPYGPFCRARPQDRDCRRCQ